MDKKDFEGFNHGKDTIKIGNRFSHLWHLKPVEIHLKEDGALDDEPSFAILMENSMLGYGAIGQISVKMFNEGLKDVGYKIVKIDGKE
jgi:hypothetical protein